MRRKTAFTAVLTALLVLGLAGSASASWTHKGKGELKENASLTLTGSLTLSTSAGDVTCPTTIGATLTASSSSGHVNSFTVSKPSECDLTGSLAAICGTNGLTKVEKTGTWALTAEETDIVLSSIDVHYALAGCLIPSFRLKGSATASLDKTTAIGKATLSGTQTLYNALEEESGTGSLTGSLTASPAGTYGVKTAPLVETRWTDEDEHLSSDGELTLTGTFSFSGSGGGVSCPATMKLALESSTVEEEEPEGELKSFAVSSPGECDVTGSLGTLCGTKSVASVEQTGTATIVSNEEDISTQGLVLDYKFNSCAVSSLRVEGGPTISVSAPDSIASATFSAGDLQLYNAENEKTGTASAGGSASASPGGTYQVAETNPIDNWYTDSTPVGGPSEKDTVTLTGEIRSTAGGGLINNGPCDVEADVDLWNENGEGTGSVTDFAVTENPCPAVIFGVPCEIEEVQLLDLDWQVDVEADTVIKITEAGFVNIYAEGCPIATSSATGDATGVFNNETSCIEFNNAGDLKAIPSGAPVTLDGKVCDDAETLTLKE